MQDAITRNSIEVTCKPEVLQSFWTMCAIQDTNIELAKAMGIHPSGASRSKQTAIKKASQMVTRYGIPTYAVETRAGEEVLVMSSDGTQLTISKKEAQILLPLLNALRGQEVTA